MPPETCCAIRSASDYPASQLCLREAQIDGGACHASECSKAPLLKMRGRQTPHIRQCVEQCALVGFSACSNAKRSCAVPVGLRKVGSKIGSKTGRLGRRVVSP